MSVSARSLLVPGVALATAGIVALGPTAVAPPVVTMAQPVVSVPTVHIDDIALAGIGTDIYNQITQFVQYTVASATYWIALVPIIGPPIADQVDINYFGLIQPVIASTVYSLADIIANPFNIVGVLANYGANLYNIGYNWVSYQLQFFGLPPLPPIPGPVASVKPAGRGAAAVEAPRAVSRAAAAARVARPSAAVAAPAATSDATPAAEGRATAKAEAPSGKAAASRAGARGDR